MKNEIIALYDKTKFNAKDRQIFEQFKQKLNEGKIRSAEKINGSWVVHHWVKKGILVGFKMGKIIEMPISKMTHFLDKDTYQTRNFSIAENIRIVPGGSAVREGAFIGKNVVMMPPMYVNVGAFVDTGTMIDSHALVGTCAQIGKNVHLSAASQIGGVLEPINANPVIIEDDVFIGGNCGIYEGVLIKSRAIIAAGVILTAGTPVYDAVNKKYLPKNEGNAVIIPENAVVVSGNRPLKSNPEFSIYCPIIIKYRDEKSEKSVNLEADLR